MGSLFLLLYWALQVYQLVLLARVLMSWIPNLDPNNPIARFLYQATEPCWRRFGTRYLPWAA